MYKYGIVKALPKDIEDSREIEFIISTETKDRHGDKLLIKNWDLQNYNLNGVVGYQHNVWGADMCEAPNPDYMLGPGKAWVEGKSLIGSVDFETADINPLADKIFKKVLHGTLKSASVGLVETKQGYYENEGTEDQVYVLGGQELVEWSIVNIPANPEAVRKHFGTNYNNALQYLDKVLGDKYTKEELMEMKIKHIIEVLDGKFYDKKEEEGVKNDFKGVDPKIKWLDAINYMLT